MDVINQMLKIECMKHGMCDKFASVWNVEFTKDEILEHYKKNIEFFMSENFPSKEKILELFDRDMLKAHHVYVGEEEFADGDFSGFAVVQDGSCGELHFAKFNAATVYVRHDSEVHISVSGRAWALVHVYDNAHVTVEQSGGGKVTVKRHSKDAVVMRTGDVKYIDPYEVHQGN